MNNYADKNDSFYKHLFSLAIPMAVQNLITTSLGLVDTFMVAMIGSAELSAITAANSLVFLIQILVFGFTSGMSVLVSQYWGHKDIESINRVMGATMYAGLMTSGIIAILLFMFPEFAIGLITNNPLLIETGAPYVRIVGISYIFNTFASIYIGMQRSTENPMLGTAVFTTSVLLNTILNYCLIFGKFGFPQLGITGAAIATLMSRIAEFIMSVIYILRNKRIRLSMKPILNPGISVFKKFFSCSAPVIFNEFGWGLGSTMITVILGHMAISADILSAYAVMNNIDKIAVVLCYGVADASAIILGKFIGSGTDEDKIYSFGCRMLRLSLLIGAFISVLLAVLLPTVFVPRLFPLFNLSEFASQAAALMCVVYLIQLPVRSYNNTLITGVLRSGGDIKAAIIIDLVPLWCITIPVTALMSLVLNAPLVFICMGIYSENIFKIPFSVTRLKSRKWIRDITK